MAVAWRLPPVNRTLLAVATPGTVPKLLTRLRKAVENQRWVLHYQPVIELATTRMTGVEALVRWLEPDGTMVPPGEFIPLAEELGLIEAIGDWVVSELVYQAGAWRDLGIDIDIGFNLSPRQFWQPDLAERVIQHIVAGGIDPAQIVSTDTPVRSASCAKVTPLSAENRS